MRSKIVSALSFAVCFLFVVTRAGYTLPHTEDAKVYFYVWVPPQVSASYAVDHFNTRTQGLDGS